MTTGKTALIIGASRGLGYALAAEYLTRGWQVTATVRGTRPTDLHDLAGKSDGRLAIETVDITVPTRHLAYWDNGWHYEPGDYRLRAGTSVVVYSAPSTDRI